MPLGSSSAAPVMSPGPSRCNNPGRLFLPTTGSAAAVGVTCAMAQFAPAVRKTSQQRSGAVAVPPELPRLLGATLLNRNGSHTKTPPVVLACLAVGLGVALVSPRRWPADP